MMEIDLALKKAAQAMHSQWLRMAWANALQGQMGSTRWAKQMERSAALLLQAQSATAMHLQKRLAEHSICFVIYTDSYGRVV